MSVVTGFIKDTDGEFGLWAVLPCAYIFLRDPALTSAHFDWTVDS